MIPPSEWLPLVWGETGEAQFPDQKSAEGTNGAVMAHYDSVIEAITGSLWVEPTYEVDPNSDEVMWEPWVDGFTRDLIPNCVSTILHQSRPEIAKGMENRS